MIAAVYARKPVVLADLSSDRLFQTLGRHGLRAGWLLPIFSSGRQVLGSLALFHPTAVAPSE